MGSVPGVNHEEEAELDFLGFDSPQSTFPSTGRASALGAAFRTSSALRVSSAEPLTPVDLLRSHAVLLHRFNQHIQNGLLLFAR